ncbi:Uncharacterised protein [Bordetella pertussis]|nr:Uncharacterised protein [Bordetella pertussis]
MRGRGGRVVLQAMQRIIHPRGRKRRQRPGLAGLAAPRAIDDGVVGDRQVGHVEQIAQRPPQVLDMLAFHVGAVRKGEMQRNRHIGFAHLHRHAVVLQQQADLLDEIVAEQMRLRDGGLVLARLGHVPVRQARIDRIVGLHADADGRVVGAHPSGQLTPAHHLVEQLAHEPGIAAVQLDQAVGGGDRAVEGLEGHRVRAMQLSDRIVGGHGRDGFRSDTTACLLRRLCPTGVSPAGHRRGYMRLPRCCKPLQM